MVSKQGEGEVDSNAHADVWKGAGLVSNYLNSVRGGIPYGADQIEMALRVAGAWQPNARRILDLGCGDGVIGAAARRIWPDAALTLLDFSPSMLEAARGRFQGHSAVELVEADFGQPSWIKALAIDAQYDVVFSAYAIHHQEDDRKQSLYAELFNLLTPGGVFLNIEHVSSATPEIAAINDTLFVDTIERHHRAQGSTDTRDEIANRYYFRPDKAANRLSRVELQLGWLREIGFVDVDCFFKVMELAVFGGRKPE